MDNMANVVLQLAEKHLTPFKVRNGEIIADKCPFCNGGSHDKYTFAVGLNNGAWNCKRGSCGKSGSFKQLCEHFGELAPVGYSLPTVTEQQKKIYTRPSEDILKPMTEEIVTYFALRRISEQTMLDWRISADENGNIIFPFFRDGKFIFAKYRKPKRHVKSDGSKEWAFTNGEPILFGMDMTTFNRPLVITEGEFDALALYEAGVTNVVSVPMGCKNMDWINLCWEYLEKFNQIILFGDNDDAGLEMISVLTSRLGDDRCMVPKEYPDLIINGHNYNRLCKDANEILMAWGPEYLKNMVDSCEPTPIKGVVDVGKIVWVDPTTVPKIMTRIPMLDKMCGGFQEGGVTILSGKAGEGKSTITGSFLLNAIQDGYSTCVYSGELPKTMFLDWILLQACDRKYVSYKSDARNGLKNVPCVSAEVRNRIQAWISGKMWLYDNEIIDDENLTKSILRVFEGCARRYGCKLFVVDNLMSALISPEEENRAQAKFTAALKSFARKYRCHVLMVAHPRKSNGKQGFQNEDISGSSAIGNLADFVINVERYPTRGIRLTKNRIFGDKGFVNCDYDPATRRVFQHGMADKISYGWDRNGLELPEHPAAELEEFAIDDGTQQMQPF